MTLEVVHEIHMTIQWLCIQYTYIIGFSYIRELFERGGGGPALSWKMSNLTSFSIPKEKVQKGTSTRI